MIAPSMFVLQGAFICGADNCTRVIGAVIAMSDHHTWNSIAWNWRKRKENISLIHWTKIGRSGCHGISLAEIISAASRYGLSLFSFIRNYCIHGIERVFFILFSFHTSHFLVNRHFCKFRTIGVSIPELTVQSFRLERNAYYGLIGTASSWWVSGFKWPVKPSLTPLWGPDRSSKPDLGWSRGRSSTVFRWKPIYWVFRLSGIGVQFFRNLHIFVAYSHSPLQ